MPPPAASICGRWQLIGTDGLGDVHRSGQARWPNCCRLAFGRTVMQLNFDC